MALVHVPDRGVDAERAQGAHAADAEHDLLAQAHLAPAHVEDAGDRPVGGVVERDVGVEHQHRHAGPPAPSTPRRARRGPGRSMGTVSTPPAGRLHGQDGQPREVVVGVDVLLEAVGVHRLAEVARAVEQAHADERHAEVARRLAVVAGEDAEAARVDAERLVDPELHREVGDRPRRAAAPCWAYQRGRLRYSSRAWITSLVELRRTPGRRAGASTAAARR